IETSGRLRDQSNCRSGQNSPYIHRVCVAETPSLIDCRRNYITQCKKRNGRRNDKKADALCAGTQPFPNCCCDLLVRSKRAGHRRELSRRNRYPKETHRQKRQGLRSAKGSQRAGRKEACQKGVDKSADLYYAPAHEYWRKVSYHGRDIFVGDAQRQWQRRQHAQHHWNLNEKLKRVADHGSPSRVERQVRICRAPTKNQQRQYGRDVPEHSYYIGQKEFAMAVQDPQAPG